MKLCLMLSHSGEGFCRLFLKLLTENPHPPHEAVSDAQPQRGGLSSVFLYENVIQCLHLSGFFAILRLVMRMKELHNARLTERARELRRNATKQENHLWYDYLAQYPIRFRRQVTMQNYIVDFFCAKANLIIEVDGSQHFTPEGMAYDAERTAVLEALGYGVLRFSNEDVERSFDEVCALIDKTVKDRCAGIVIKSL